MNKVRYPRFLTAAALVLPVADASALAVVPPLPAYTSAAGAGSAAALSPLVWAPIVVLALGMCIAMIWLLREPRRPAVRKPQPKVALVARGRLPRRGRPLRTPAIAQHRMPRRRGGWAPSPG